MIGGRDFAISEGYNRSILISTELLGQRTYLFMCFGQAPDISWSWYNSSFLAVSQSQSEQSWQMSILSDFPFPKDLDSFRCRNNKLISFFALPVYSHYSSLLSLTRRCRFSLYQATSMLYPHFTEKDPRNNTTCPYLSVGCYSNQLHAFISETHCYDRKAVG